MAQPRPSLASSDVPYVVDRSERGKLAISGPEAAAALDALVTNDVTKLAPGHGLSAAVLTNKGKMLGEVRVLRTEDELLLDTDRAALQDVFDVVRRGLVGWKAELHKRTLQRALLAVVEDAPMGSEEEHLVEPWTAGDVAGLRITTWFGHEVLVDAEDRDAARAALGDLPDGTEEDLDVRRVELGRPRWGAELDGTVIPQEAGLNERFVSFTKGCYPGQETVARLHYKGKPNRSLRGLRFDRPVAPGLPLALEGREVGRVGSFVESPALGPVGLALVRREAEPGTRVAVGEDGATAEVVALPWS